MRILIILFGVCPLLAPAGQLYKCVDAAGDVSYQSSACAARQRMERIIEFAPDPPPAAPGALLAVKRMRPSTRRSRGVRRGSAPIDKPRPSACSEAKAMREAQLKRLGLERTFDDLSRIDAAVRGVCNGD